MNIIKKTFYAIYMIASVVIYYKIETEYGMEERMGIIIYALSLLGTELAIIWMIFFIVNVTHKIARKIGTIERRISQVDMSDFKFDKDYFNEIIEKYSPLVLGCLDNFTIDKNTLIATLLYMQKNGIIKIVNDRIEATTAVKLDLSDTCSMILDRIKNGKIEISNFDEFTDSIREYTLDRTEKLELVIDTEGPIIKNTKKERYRQLRKMISFIMTIIIYPIGIMYLKSIEKESWLSAAIMIFLVLYLPVKISCIVPYASGNAGHKYKRTQKGQELNNKLDGLKKYIKDFSLLSEREAKEIELWEDYLIYSVMFGQNKKIVKEYEKYIIIK